MNAREQLDKKLADYEQERSAERRWAAVFIIGLLVWTLLMALPSLLFADEGYYGALLTIYAGGIATLVAASIMWASRRKKR